MSDRRPIGVFDSGFGGLSAVRELRRLLPGEELVYLGDNARIPYGDRTPQTICEYARQDAAFLLSRGVKAILAACGTVSSVALQELQDAIEVPVVGVIQPAARQALAQSATGVIGVMGTPATVRSGAYEKTLKALGGPRVQVVSVACPLLVPLVENGYVATDCAITRLAVEEYLQPMRQRGVDVIILGCTHYPLIRSLIADVWQRDALINTGLEAAKELAGLLAEKGALSDSSARGELHLFTSERPEGLGEKAAVFLAGERACPAFERVDLLAYSL